MTLRKRQTARKAKRTRETARSPTPPSPSASCDEASLRAMLREAMTPENWALICGRAIAQAITGDAEARRWLTEMLREERPPSQ